MRSEVSGLRALLGLTQSELAELLGVTQPAVAAWEAARRRPAVTAAERLARIVENSSGPTRVYGEHRGRPIELPTERWQPVDLPPVFTFPIRLDWSPRAGPRDLSDPMQRAGAYAQVLNEGTPTDIRVWIDPDWLIELWPDVPVARHMRQPVGEMILALQG